MAEGKAVSQTHHLYDSGSNSIEEREFPTRPQRPLKQPCSCPQCGSTRLYRDGLRYLNDGNRIQRWLCRGCGFRFSQTGSDRSSHSSTMCNVSTVERQSLNPTSALPSRRQVCDLAEASKNLTEAARQETAQREGTQQSPEVRGKIIELLWQLEKDGRKEGTIRNYDKWLSHMLKNGVNLYDPESIKGFLAKRDLKDSTKVLIASICDVWLTFLKIPWRLPKYSADHEIPFIPTEQELDLLIAACGKKVATFLQILKETGARCGEITKLIWTSIDSQQKVVRITAEKGSLSRILPLSTKAIEMLNNLPKNSERIFVFADDMRSNFYLQRKRIARKLSNPRILQIHFHTFRHWKGTIEYHKTKDPIYVKEILGHKDLKSTQVYIHISHALFQNTPPEDFHVKVATTPEEITQLLEAGFEYVLQKDTLAYFRKRK